MSGTCETCDDRPAMWRLSTGPTIHTSCCCCLDQAVRDLIVDDPTLYVVISQVSE